MTAYRNRFFAAALAAVFCFVAGLSAAQGLAQAAGQSPAPGSSSAQSAGQKSGQDSSSSGGGAAQPFREKSPSLIDPAGPTVSLTSSEPLFIMAAALNACGYNEGLEESAPVRMKVREEINAALAKSEDAREKRDKVCLYIAQTG